MTRTTRLAAVAATTLLGLSLLGACGDPSTSATSSDRATSSSKSAGHTQSSASAKEPTASSSSSSMSSGTSADASIMIMDYKYSGTKKVAPGTKITLMNHDSEAHTVTADSGDAFDVTVQPGKKVTMTAPSKPGTYRYHCSFHSNMHGTLTVG